MITIALGIVIAVLTLSLLDVILKIFPYILLGILGIILWLFFYEVMGIEGIIIIGLMGFFTYLIDHNE